MTPRHRQSDPPPAGSSLVVRFGSPRLMDLRACLSTSHRDQELRPLHRAARMRRGRDSTSGLAVDATGVYFSIGGSGRRALLEVTPKQGRADFSRRRPLRRPSRQSGESPLSRTPPRPRSPACRRFHPRSPVAALRTCTGRRAPERRRASRYNSPRDTRTTPPSGKHHADRMRPERSPLRAWRPNHRQRAIRPPWDETHRAAQSRWYFHKRGERGKMREGRASSRRSYAPSTQLG